MQRKEKRKDVQLGGVEVDSGSLRMAAMKVFFWGFKEGLMHYLPKIILQPSLITTTSYTITLFLRHTQTKSNTLIEDNSVA